MYEGNYQTLRDWQMQKLRGLHAQPVSTRLETGPEPAEKPMYRNFGTIRYYSKNPPKGRFADDGKFILIIQTTNLTCLADTIKMDESLFSSEVITELSVKFVSNTSSFLRRSCMADSSLLKDLFSYTPEEYESKVLELKTKLEIQPNYEFNIQYDDPKAVASLFLLFLKYVSYLARLSR